MDNEISLKAVFLADYDEIHLVVKRTIRKYFSRFCLHDNYEDLVQESMAAIFAALADDRLRSRSNLLAFAASVAFFTGCRVVPREKRFPHQLDEFCRFPDQGRSPEELVLEKEGRDHIRRAIMALNNSLDREIVRRWSEGEKLNELRVSMRLSPGQFRNRKSRALKSILNYIQKLQGQPGRTPGRVPAGFAVSQNVG